MAFQIVDHIPFDSKEFHEFGKKWSFEVVTSSPKYPQLNGLAAVAESNVQTTRQMLTASRGEPENACTCTINIIQSIFDHS